MFTDHASRSEPPPATGAFSGLIALLAALGLAILLVMVLGSGDTSSIAEGSRSVVVSAAVEDVAAPVVVDDELGSENAGAELEASDSDAAVAESAPLLTESEFTAFDTAVAQVPADVLGDDEGKVKIKIKWLDEQGIKVEVVTGLFVEEGDAVHNGDRVIEVSERPIFVFEGVVPATRSLEAGDEGADVAQLEAALAALGYGVGAHDGVYDAGLAAGIASFYADNGYSLPDPKTSDIADVRELVADLDDLAAERKQKQIELVDETMWGVTDDGFQKREEKALEIDYLNERIARIRQRGNPFRAEAARIGNLINAIQGSYASGNFGFLDTDDLPRDLRTEFRRLTSDDTDEFETIDALIDELRGALDSVNDDIFDLDIDIEEAIGERDIAQSEFSQLERERYVIEDSSKADDIRLDIERLDIQIAQKHADLADAQQKLIPELVVDEFVFVPNLPGEVDEVKVELRDPADDGTLIEVVTGDQSDEDEPETEVTADGEVAVEDDEEPADEEAAEDDAAEDDAAAEEEPADEG